MHLQKVSNSQEIIRNTSILYVKGQVHFKYFVKCVKGFIDNSKSLPHNPAYNNHKEKALWQDWGKRRKC